MFDRKKYKTFALEQLKGRWASPVLMLLIVSGIMALFTIPRNLFTLDSAAVKELSELININPELALQNLLGYRKQFTGTSILSIIQSLVSFILSFASINLYLQLSRSPEPVSLKAFIEGLNNWGRGILTGLYEFLWLFLWMLIAIPATSIGAIIFAIMVTTESTANIVIGVLIFSAFIIAGFIPALIKSISYSMTFYIAAEFENVSVPKALTISKIITKGNKLNLFVTYLSFIGWFFLVALTAGLASLWVSPYLDMTLINAYHALVKDSIENGSLKPEDLQ